MQHMARLEPMTYSLAGLDYTVLHHRATMEIATGKKSRDTRFAMA